jgi:hypothetical protein
MPVETVFTIDFVAPPLAKTNDSRGGKSVVAIDYHPVALRQSRGKHPVLTVVPHPEVNHRVLFFVSRWNLTMTQPPWMMSSLNWLKTLYFF